MQGSSLLRRNLLASLRRLHRIKAQDPVDDEYRGWNWDAPPLRPRAYLGLGVSEVAYKYCPTRRDVFLRRNGVQGVKTQSLINGELAHAVFHYAAEDARKLLLVGLSGWEVYDSLRPKAASSLRRRGIDVKLYPWLLDLYNRLLLGFCAEESPLYLSEHRVDGSTLGLSKNLRVDGLMDMGVVLEVKLGKPQDFHKYALAGYALALEADTEVPVDYGLIVYLEVFENRRVLFNWEPVYLSPALRASFIESRDELIDILLSGREPPKAKACPESCPFIGVCT